MTQKKSRYLFSTINSGSTLFCALLCNTIRTWCEPPELEYVIPGGFVEVDQQHIYLAPSIKGRKVFLYRSLPSHLCAGMLEMKNDFLGIHHFWLDRWISTIQLGLNSTNVMWVESNDFFEDVRGTMDKVCSHYKIPKIERLDWAGYNVKLTVPKRSPNELILNQPSGFSDYCAKDGIIDRKKSLELQPVKKAVDVIQREYPDLHRFM